MLKLLRLIFCLTILSSKTFSQNSQSDFSFNEPTDTTKLFKLTLWATQYYIHKFPSGGKIPIVLEDGKPSGLYADTCDFCAASLEGTAFITDSVGNVTVINYAKTGEETFVNCRECKKYSKSKLAVESWGKVVWKKTNGFGDGVLHYKLIPFRTIAVDKKVIPYGTVIFIPKVKGLMILLPNGQKVIHDGYFFAGDTGGAIKETHIDVFTGVCEENPFSDVIKSNAAKTFEAYIITDSTIISSLTKLQTK
jgi:3D (Asp-Asp-Asp) domain-containing protein